MGRGKISILSVVLSLLVVTGCEKEPDASPSEPAKGESGGGATAAERWGSPEATAKTFIDAAVKKDADLLSKSFSAKSEGEFKPLAEKTATQEQLDELKTMFDGASVTGTEISADGTQASVDVDLPKSARKKETLNLLKEGEAWKIQGF